MDYELNEDQEVLLKQLTHKIKLVEEKISQTNEYEKEALEEERMVYQKNIDDLRFGALLIHYIKLSDEQKTEWWKNEFSDLLKLHLALDNIYEIFNRESYDRWSEIELEFDEYLYMICNEYDLEYEFAFRLCELSRESDEWKQLIKDNQE